MTDPTAHGGSAHRGTTGQPLAEQPTTEVVYDRHGSGSEPSHPAPYQPHPAPRYHEAGYHGAWYAEAGYEPVGDDYQDDLDVFDGRYDGDEGPYDGDDDRAAPDDRDDLDVPGWTPDHSTAPVAVRRADVLAGLLLLLAGMAAGVGLLVVWVDGGPTGLDLVRDGIADVRSGTPSGAWWPPLAVVGGGVALFALGLLMYAPARTHRFLGVLALLVSLVAAAGVLVPLADAGWDLEGFAVGAWFAVAVAGLGLLGALKAMSTAERCTSGGWG